MPTHRPESPHGHPEPYSHLRFTSIGFNVARSTGPALAGVLIATRGTASCYAVQTGCYLLAVVWTLWLRPTPSAATSGRAAPGASFGQSIVEGWTFSWRNEAVRAGRLVAMGASLFMMPFTLGHARRCRPVWDDLL